MKLEFFETKKEDKWNVGKRRLVSLQSENAREVAFLQGFVNQKHVDYNLDIGDTIIIDPENIFAQMKLLDIAKLDRASEDFAGETKGEINANIRPGPLSGGDASGLSTPD